MGSDLEEKFERLLSKVTLMQHQNVLEMLETAAVLEALVNALVAKGISTKAELIYLQEKARGDIHKKLTSQFSTLTCEECEEKLTYSDGQLNCACTKPKPEEASHG